MSKIEDSVITKISTRAEIGKKKYGVTMERTDLSTLYWLRHTQEEAMDTAVYLEKLIQIEEKKEKVFKNSEIYKKNIPL